MSAFVLVHRRDGFPLAREVVERMLSAIAHRGPDGHRIVATHALGLGCQDPRRLQSLLRRTLVAL